MTRAQFIQTVLPYVRELCQGNLTLLEYLDRVDTINSIMTDGCEQIKMEISDD